MKEDVKAYYIHNVMPRVNEMLLGLIGIGVLILSVTYIHLVTLEPEILLNENYWKRIFLIVIIIAFAAYNAIVYYAYANEEGQHVPRTDRPLRVFGLFLLDLAQITFAACMFGTMYIESTSDTLANGACATSLDSPQCLALDKHSIVMIYALGALWHLSVAAWYVIAESWSNGNVRSHGGFMLLYLLLILATTTVGLFSDWLAISIFGVIVALVYHAQGERWLGPAPASARK